MESEITRKEGRIISIVCLQDGDEITLHYYFDVNGKISRKTIEVPKDRHVPSITDIYPTADFYEREIHDYYDVEFTGNKNLHLPFFLPEEKKGSHDA